MENPTPELDRHDHVLLGLAMNIQATAMVQMGKLVDPSAGEIKVDLAAARISIDILEALQAKCKGNLAEDVESLIDRVVMDLQLNYTDEVKKGAQPDDEAEQDTPESADGGDDAEA